MSLLFDDLQPLAGVTESGGTRAGHLAFVFLGGVALLVLALIAHEDKVREASP